MNHLTLSTVKRQTRRALRDNGLGHADIINVEWLGERSQYRDGSRVWFRIAAVTIGIDGRQVRKSATVETTGAFSIR